MKLATYYSLFGLLSTCAGPHRGVPNILAAGNNHAARIPVLSIPTLDEAVASYTSLGGHLSPVTLFGTDPLSNSSELLHERERVLEQALPSPEDIFANTVNGDYSIFAQSLTFLIDTTNRLSS